MYMRFCLHLHVFEVAEERKREGLKNEGNREREKVRVCVRERQRKRQREIQRERQRERKYVCVWQRERERERERESSRNKLPRTRACSHHINMFISILQIYLFIYSVICYLMTFFRVIGQLRSSDLYDSRYELNLHVDATKNRRDGQEEKIAFTACHR